MSVSVLQINVASEPDRTFFLRLDWAEDLGAGFVVVLCDGVSVWTGEVSEEDISREAEEMEVQREGYVRDLQLALTGQGQGVGGYGFHLSPEGLQSGRLYLSYEKVQKDFSFRLGSVELQPVPEPHQVIRELIRHGLERSSELAVGNRRLQEENGLLKREQERIASEMERYVQGKETLEKDLYARFVLVLNEKKALIRSLQEKIKRLQEDLEKKELSREAGPAKAKAPEKRPSPARGATPPPDEYDTSTDDEQERRVRQSPAPDEKHAHSFVEENLSDLTDVAPTRKRRIRHPRPEVKKASPEVPRKRGAWPVPAKDGSTERAVQPPSASPAANPQAEDLFDDF